jgi:hypothetical protein
MLDIAREEAMLDIAREEAMLGEVQSSILALLGRSLHNQIDDELLPERWVDLIRYLDEQERQRAGARQPEGNRHVEVAAMIDALQIKEHMDVQGSDGKHVGTVLGVENGRIKLASGGMDHTIDIATVDAVRGDVVHLRKTAEETVRTWH